MSHRSFKIGPGRFDPSACDPDWVARTQALGKIGAWSAVVEDGVHWWSEAVFDLYEVPRDLTAAPTIEDFFPSEQAAAIMQAYLEAVRCGAPWSLESPFVTGRGRQLFVRSTGMGYVRADGKTIICGCFQDVTEYHAARVEAQESQRFVESILDNLPHMIFVKEAKDLRFVKFNKAGCELLGIPASALLGRSDYDLFPKDQADFFVAKDRQTMAGRVTLDIPEEAIDTPNGRRFLHTKKITIEGDDGLPAFLIGISEDVTDRKQHEETIERQRLALAQTSRLSALGQMAGGIAHEINNPLAIIKGIATQMQWIVEQEEIDRDRLTELTTKVAGTVDRIAKIIRGLRDFSRDGSSDPVQSTSVRELVEQTLALCSEKLKMANIKVETRIEPQDLCFDVQIVRVSQVLLNILNNAYDALVADGSCTPRIRISACLTPGGDVTLSIEDNGSGIAPEDLDSVMAPFFTTKPFGKGTGLGLSISRGICEALGGSLRHLPTDRRGATFVISLPQKRRPAGAA